MVFTIILHTTSADGSATSANLVSAVSTLRLDTLVEEML